jgi:hypothetical protein
MPTSPLLQHDTAEVDSDLEEMIQRAVQQPGVAETIAVYEYWRNLQVRVSAVEALQNPQPTTTVTASSQPVPG